MPRRENMRMPKKSELVTANTGIIRRKVNTKTPFVQFGFMIIWDTGTTDDRIIFPSNNDLNQCYFVHWYSNYNLTPKKYFSNQ